VFNDAIGVERTRFVAMGVPDRANATRSKTWKDIALVPWEKDSKLNSTVCSSYSKSLRHSAHCACFGVTPENEFGEVRYTVAANGSFERVSSRISSRPQHRSRLCTDVICPIHVFHLARTNHSWKAGEEPAHPCLVAAHQIRCNRILPLP
jgi:hypothetical protein